MSTVLDTAETQTAFVHKDLSLRSLVDEQGLGLLPCKDHSKLRLVANQRCDETGLEISRKPYRQIAKHAWDREDLHGG